MAVDKVLRVTIVPNAQNIKETIRERVKVVFPPVVLGNGAAVPSISGVVLKRLAKKVALTFFEAKDAFKIPQGAIRVSVFHYSVAELYDRARDVGLEAKGNRIFTRLPVCITVTGFEFYGRKFTFPTPSEIDSMAVFPASEEL